MRRIFAAAVLLGLLGLLGAPVQARADWVDNFDGGLAAWTFGSVIGQPDTFSATAADGVLTLADPNAAATGGSLIGYGYRGGFYDDVLVTGTINPTGTSDANLGLAARADFASGSGYFLTYNPTDGGLAITEATALTTQNLGETAIAADLESIYMTFRLIGESLEARVFDQFGGTELAFLQAVNSDHSTGFAGVITQADSSSVPFNATWGSVSATAVPEPGSLALLAALGLYGARKRYRVAVAT